MSAAADAGTDDACWICGNPRTEPIVGSPPGEPLTPDDLRISDKRYGLTLPLQRCDGCGFVFAQRDHLPVLTDLYAELDDAEYGASAEGRRRQMAHLLRWATAGRRGGERLLDVGAASGILLKEAAARGLDGVGVEPSRALAQRARDNGLVVYDGVLPHPELDDATFDIVTLIDVVEHVADPITLLAECRRVLGPGGRLVVVTPDLGSVAARALGRRWWHRRLAHVGYFDRSTLTLALGRAGLTPERWARPRWYFPVGYLFSRVLEYVPGASLSGGGQSVPASGGFVIPLNLRDSYAVVARAT